MSLFLGGREMEKLVEHSPAVFSSPTDGVHYFVCRKCGFPVDTLIRLPRELRYYDKGGKLIALIKYDRCPPQIVAIEKEE